jgi:GNAT superfamily N-acetyltransferase
MTHPASIDRGKLKFRLGTVDAVLAFAEKHGSHYFHEAGFDAYSAFDLERAKREMARQINSGDTPFILAEIDGEAVGLVSWMMSHVFTERPIAYLWMIYVTPPHRRGPIGRLLLWFAADIAKVEGACAFFATVPPTSPAARALCNLFRKCGFAPMGGAFTRRL